MSYVDVLKFIFSNFISLAGQQARAGVSMGSDGFQTVGLSKKQRLKHVKHISVKLADKDIVSEEEIDTLNRAIRSRGYDIITDLQLPHR